MACSLAGEFDLQSDCEEFETLSLHMNEEIYNWLESMFMRSNIPKYRKYFKEWVDGLTEGQITGFDRMMKADYVYKKQE